MNFLRIFYTTSVATLFAAVSMYAGTTQNCGCAPCKKTPIASFEKCLKNIRGTACVSNITREEGNYGPITKVCLVPTRGSETFSIQNTTFSCNAVDDLLGKIFCTHVQAAKVCKLQFDVLFTCPCSCDPSVVLTLENSLCNFIAECALVNSITLAVSNVTPFGFTVNVLFSVYGDSCSAINDLLASILNPSKPFCINFIAQCK